jgi:hypothetical protein
MMNTSRAVLFPFLSLHHAPDAQLAARALTQALDNEDAKGHSTKDCLDRNTPVVQLRR